MTTPCEELENTVHRECELLRPLTAVDPGAAVRARIVAAVHAQAAVLGRRRRRLQRAASVAGLAAALVFAWGLSWRAPATVVTGGLRDPLVVVSDWSAALDDSQMRFSRALDDGWPSLDTGDPDEVDDLFRALDSTLDRFESL